MEVTRRRYQALARNLSLRIYVTVMNEVFKCFDEAFYRQEDNKTEIPSSREQIALMIFVNSHQLCSLCWGFNVLG